MDASEIVPVVDAPMSGDHNASIWIIVLFLFICILIFLYPAYKNYRNGGVKSEGYK
jgi:hypothetical protein